ncbi:MAG: anthranilate phosphoribosyltransferase [Gammaproteobacteria bacterium]|nr:anthranilate phosphoribosyltransferase [Gammaproteobacteria bacterium]MYK84665.1 anthranilate phosphoribosyltransferase [Gammaproteobacteria bacterium]
MDIQTALAALVAGRSLSQEDANAVFRQVMSGDAAPAQTGALLTALRMKGETPAEVAGAAEAMRALSLRVEVEAEHLVDTCGTGGSGAKLFNISTAAGFVAAAAGARVAKHGNRKMTGFSGSADVLEAAGVNLELTPAQIAHCIREIGIGFLFAQRHHGAMRHAAPVRQALGFRTLMNVLGPLTNPAGARRQVIGVFSPDWLRPLAEVAKRLGGEQVLIVHAEGLDELAIDGPSQVCELKGGRIEQYEVVPEDFGLTRRDAAGLRADSTESSLSLVRESLTRPDSAAADIVALNAGAAIYAAGVALDHAAGVEMAQDAIAAGLAKERLDELARVSRMMGRAGDEPSS